MTTLINRSWPRSIPLRNARVRARFQPPPSARVRTIRVGLLGCGTVGREIVEEITRLGLTLDCVVVNASGGGLTAGIALAVKARAPGASIYTAEPAAFDDHVRSFESGKRAGRWSSYYANGQVRERAVYSSGQLEGCAERFDEEGNSEPSRCSGRDAGEGAHRDGGG